MSKGLLSRPESRYGMGGKPYRRYGYAAIVALIGLLYLLLEWNTTPTLVDDVVYRFQFTASGGLPPEPIHDLGDVLRSQYWHYLTINGRAPAHFLAQTFLTLVPEEVLNVLNAALFALLIHLCVRVIAPPREGKTACAALVGGTVFVFLRGFQGAMLWQLGTFNYLWPLVINLFLFLSLRHGDAPLPYWRAITLLPVAIVAGWTHEGLSLPVSLGLATWLTMHFRRAGKLRTAPILAAYMAGTCLCLASPGIWHRAGDAPTLLNRAVNGCVAVATNVRLLWPLLLTLAVLWRKGCLNRPLLLRFLPAAVTLSAAYGIVFASGVTLDRVAFHAEMLSLLALLALWWRVFAPTVLRVLGIVMAAIALICFVPAWAMCRQQVANYHYAVAQMERPGTSIIRTRDVKPANWLEQIAASRYVMPFADYGFYSCYMGFDAEDSNMRCAASLYGKPRLWFLPEDMAAKMDSDSSAFRHFAPDAGNRLWAKRLPRGQKVSGVEFVLSPEDPAKLHLWQRMVAYKGDRYPLDDFHWEVIRVAGRQYLVCTQPVTAVRRRVKSIEIR